MTRLLILLPFTGVLLAYLGLRLAPGIGWPIWLMLVICIAGVFSFPLSWHWRNGRKNINVRKINVFLWAVYLDMGFLSFLGSFTLLRDFIGLPLAWLRPETSHAVFGAVGTEVLLALTLATNVFGIWQAMRGPRVRRIEIPIVDLPRGLVGYKIAQISDLHLGATIGRGYVDRVVGLVNSLTPNLTVFTGDIGDGEVTESNMQNALEGFRHLHPDQAKLFVPGNHEYYWNARSWIEAIENLGIEALLNTRRILTHGSDQLLIGGAIDPAARLLTPPMQQDVVAAMGAPIKVGVKILLVHNPSAARAAAKAGFDLQISGHTHAGQFFPWTLVVRRVHEFAHGLKACGKMWVYVNSGTGSWGPPMRVGSRTEITLLTLAAA